MMSKRLLSCALAAVLLAGVCSQASAVATSARPFTPAAPTMQDDASTYKFTDGGIQFSVPAGWEVKPDGDGAVKVFPKTGGNVQIAFVALPIATDLNPEEKRSEDHTSELQSRQYLHSFPTRRSSDLLYPRRADDARRREHLQVY